MRDFHPSGKAVEDQPADLVLQNGDQVREVAKIVLSAVNRGREMAFKRLRNVEHLIAAGMIHQQGRGAEDLVCQVGVEKRLRISLKQRCLRAETAALPAWRSFGQEFDLLVCPAILNRRTVRRADSFRQKMEGASCFHQLL